MAGFKRYRVRTVAQDYGDAGPDLLRTRGNAVHQLGRLVSARTGFYIRKDTGSGGTKWGPWDGPFNRAPMLDKVDTWCNNAGAKAKLQVGRKVSGKMQPRFELVVVGVQHVNLPGVHAGAELVADLNRAQWGSKINILGFTCREFNNVPGSGWSDHAWGDAVDLVPQGNLSNDHLTDWNVRMAREGLMGSVDQFIGSRNRRVYNFVEPNYVANLGGPSSHLTHVHCSYVQHYGRDPNCR